MSIDIRELVVVSSKSTISKELPKVIEGAVVTGMSRDTVVIQNKEYVELTVQYDVARTHNILHKALYVYYGANGGFYYVTKYNKLVPARTYAIILRRALKQANKDTKIGR